MENLINSGDFAIFIHQNYVDTALVINFLRLCRLKCGKALPFRQVFFNLVRLRLTIGGVAAIIKEQPPPERRSLSAHRAAEPHN